MTKFVCILLGFLAVAVVTCAATDVQVSLYLTFYCASATLSFELTIFLFLFQSGDEFYDNRCICICPSFQVIGEEDTGRKIYISVLSKEKWYRTDAAIDNARSLSLYV